MRFVIDVHLHSRYARATSRDLNPENLHKWSALKGIDVVGTGDFTHPEWFAELQEKLEPAEEGLFQLKSQWRDPVDVALPERCRAAVRFMLSVEISSIYKKNGRTRKIHNIVLLPGFAEVAELNRRLGAIGNLKADGRPILGLDSRDLLEICLEVNEDVLFIPAHIWTPHFSVLGASSGFDSLEECYEDLLPHIFAVETGLSSDPPMNWRLSALDRYSIVSNSDAHSPQKLAREATCFDTERSYPAIYAALKDRDPQRFTGTLEFYPNEGKYHYDGHRKCGIRWKPQQTLNADGICPKCGRKLTVGVLHRAELLADRPEGADPQIKRAFEYLIPLAEIIGASIGVGPKSKKVQGIYHQLLEEFGPELHILRRVDAEEIARSGEPLVAEGVRRMRRGAVEILSGFDGEFGTIRVFSDEEREQLKGQTLLFELPTAAAPEDALFPAAAMEFEIEETAPTVAADDLDEPQRRAVEAAVGPCVVVAGPGSGKTRTLTRRIAHLIEVRNVEAAQIMAVTFTNRAAAEMRQRLGQLLPSAAELDALTVGTFHRVALNLLRDCGAAEKTVLDQVEARGVLESALEDAGLSLRSGAALSAISLAKAAAQRPEEIEGEVGEAYGVYQRQLAAFKARDYDDILLDLLELLENDAPALARLRARFTHVLVDEFQDVNAVQYKLVKMLAGAGEGLFAIGDADQAIYSFRGAEPRYFARLLEDFPQAQRFHLGTNYRSSATIVEAAAEVIQCNSGRLPLPMRPVQKAGPKIRLLSVPGETAEGIAVVREISRQVGGADMVQADQQVASSAARSFADFAVLFRTGRQAATMEQCFLQEGLPYRLIGHKGFLDAAKVRQALTLCRFIAYPQDALRLLSALELPTFHPGAAALKEVRRWVGQESMTSALLQERVPAAATKVQMLVEAGQRYASLADSQGVGAMLRQWQTDCAGEADADLEQLAQVGDGAASLEKLLDTVLLGLEADYERRSGKAVEEEAVQLMTLHAAKGLEFPVVCFGGVEDGLVPLRDKDADIEEERRLFYVGLTRAQEELILSHCRSRMRFGQRLEPTASPFVRELPEQLVSGEKVEMPQRQGAIEQLSLF